MPSDRAQALRVLAHEASDPAPVPPRSTREEPPIGDRRVAVRDDRLRDVPALPAGFRRAVAEVDVLSVEPVARVEAAELVEHLPPEEEEGREHPVGLRRLRGPVLEEVVVELP